MPRPLTVEDIYHSIKFLSQIISTNDTMEVLSNRPLDICTYNQISNFSKAELEGLTIKNKSTDVLYTAVMVGRNPFLLSALLEKGAFVHKLSDMSQFILESANERPLELYNAIYYMENSPQNPHCQLDRLADFLNPLDTQIKKDLAGKWYNKYGDVYYETLVSYIGNNLFQREKLCTFFIDKLEMDGKDINLGFPLNKFLPQHEQHRLSQNFFISATEVKKIEGLLSKGFRFDEENYHFDGDTLMTTILKSNRPDIVKTILPYLTKVIPNKITLEEQHLLVEGYKKNPAYEEIKTTYFKAVFDHIIPVKTGNTKRVKI